MTRHRKFIIGLTGALFLFLSANILIWELFTQDLLSDIRYQGGDLARMAYLPGSKMPRQNVDDLPRRHMEFDNYSTQQVRLLTIGDSFSNGGGGGRNRYFQDYLATYSDIPVLNIPPFDRSTLQGTIEIVNPIETVAILANNGFLKKAGVRTVLVAVSEKQCLGMLTQRVNFDTSITVDALRLQKRVNYQVRLPEVGFINTGNLTFLLNEIRSRLANGTKFGNVRVLKLDRPLFSVRDANRLLIYKGDLEQIKFTVPATIGQLNQNLNELARRLENLGIVLYFMPCADKYNVYNEYIVDNPYPPSVFFEELRRLPHRYRLIDTKAILAEELRKGTLDLYFPDDSHWSWKASETIFRQARFE